jgi:hypothetical protein
VSTERVACDVGACTATVLRRNLGLRTAAGAPHVLRNRHIAGVLIDPVQVEFCGCDAPALEFRYPSGKSFAAYDRGHLIGRVCTRCRRVRCTNVPQRVALLARARSMRARISAWRLSERALQRDLEAESAVARFRVGRRRLVAIALALHALQLPVLLVLAIFDADCEHAPLMDQPKRWSVARVVKHFEPRTALLNKIKRLETENAALQRRARGPE